MSIELSCGETVELPIGTTHGILGCHTIREATDILAADCPNIAPRDYREILSAVQDGVS